MMKQLQLLLIDELHLAGLNVRQSPAGRALRRVTEPVCALSLHSAQVTDAALGHYLGLIADPERGESELYGQAFTAQARLAVFAPAPDGCDGCAGAMLDALLGVRGLSLSGLELSEAQWDDDAAAFRREVKADLRGILYHSRMEESGEFTDFRLVPTVHGKEKVQ